MSSIIKVNTYQDANGNALFSSDGSGNVTLSSNDMKMTPAFFATSDSGTTISNSTWVKVSVGTEVFDTNNDYDTSTSRFTPSIAGKYFITAGILGNSQNVGQLREIYLAIYKNGSIHTMLHESNLNNAYDEFRRTATGATIDTANGTSDYYEIYTHINNTSGSPVVTGAGQKGIKFGAYRIIGA